MLVGRVLRTLRHFMLEADACLFYIPFRAYVDFALGVVPFKVEATVFGSFSVLFDFVMVFERCDEMVSVLLADVFYAKIIDAQGK